MAKVLENVLTLYYLQDKPAIHILQHHPSDKQFIKVSFVLPGSGSYPTQLAFHTSKHTRNQATRVFILGTTVKRKALELSVHFHQEIKTIKSRASSEEQITCSIFFKYFVTYP